MPRTVRTVHMLAYRLQLTITRTLQAELELKMKLSRILPAKPNASTRMDVTCWLVAQYTAAALGQTELYDYCVEERKP